MTGRKISYKMGSVRGQMKERNEEIKMFLIAGLGNPSTRYEKTRHNIGFDVIDAVSERYNIEVKEKKAKALCGSGFVEAAL